jgi:hypothetical protein
MLPTYGICIGTQKRLEMKQKIIFAVPAALLFLACVIGMAWRHGSSLAQSAVSQDWPAAPTQLPAEQKIEFAPMGALDYFDDRGFRGSRQVFQSTDGVGIELITEWRNSPKAAGAALNEKLRAAGRVIERSTLLKKEGLIYGDRALAYFPRSGEDGERPAVLRTDGKTFYYFESTSLLHLLLLEKELFVSKSNLEGQVTPTGLCPVEGRK